MDVVKMLLEQFASNPMFQGAVLSLLIAQLKNFSVTIDSKVKDPANVNKVNGVIAFLSLLVTVLGAYAQGHLAQLDWTALLTSAQVFLSALGVHLLGTKLKENGNK